MTRSEIKIKKKKKLCWIISMFSVAGWHAFFDSLSTDVIYKGRVVFNSSNIISHHSFQVLYFDWFFVTSAIPLIYISGVSSPCSYINDYFFSEEIYDTKLWLIHDVRRENSLSPFPFRCPYDFGLIHKLGVSPFFFFLLQLCPQLMN